MTRPYRISDTAVQEQNARLGPNKKKRENRGPEFENRKVENPMGIATWPDLATQNAIEKNDKNKCRPLAWEIHIRTIWAGNLFS